MGQLHLFNSKPFVCLPSVHLNHEQNIHNNMKIIALKICCECSGMPMPCSSESRTHSIDWVRRKKKQGKEEKEAAAAHISKLYIATNPSFVCILSLIAFRRVSRAIWLYVSPCGNQNDITVWPGMHVHTQSESGKSLFHAPREKRLNKNTKQIQHVVSHAAFSFPLLPTPSLPSIMLNLAIRHIPFQWNYLPLYHCISNDNSLNWNEKLDLARFDSSKQHRIKSAFLCPQFFYPNDANNRL